MKIINDPELINKYQQKLRSRFFFQTDKKVDSFLFWGENVDTAYDTIEHKVNYNSRLNIWGCHIPNLNENGGHWNWFGMGEPHSNQIVAKLSSVIMEVFLVVKIY